MSQVFIRKDSSTGKNWDNQHGAIQAIEEHLDTNFYEKMDFVLAHRES